jgi:hypothetical protein
MYKKRNIRFKEQLTNSDWSTKAYTISENENFKAVSTYEEVKKNLPIWLEQLNSFDSRHENVSFVILHEASEGVFVLVNTWVGKNMLQTHIYLSKYEDPTKFEKISGDGLFACVWELEVINHERNAWTKHVLKRGANPDSKSYLNEILNTEY